MIVLIIIYFLPIAITLLTILFLRVMGSVKVSGKEHVFILASVAPFLNWVVMVITVSYVFEEMDDL